MQDTMKPRICKLLGVEVGERFKIDYPYKVIPYLTVAENGTIWAHEDNGGKNKIKTKVLYYLLENPEKIIHLNCFSKKDRKAAGALSEILGVSYISRKENGDLIASQFLNGPGTPVKQDYFSLLLPGQSINLSAIASGWTEESDAP